MVSARFERWVMTLRIAHIPALLLLAICAGCVNVGALSRKLEVGMSEQQVLSVLGEPASVSVSTCGSETPSPWQCKTFKYEDSWVGLLIVYFQQADGGLWVVNSWSSF